jgi:hypothetical protein
MSRLLAATVSIVHAQNCMPIAPDATGGAVCGTRVLRRHLTRIRTSAYPEGDAGRQIPPSCHMVEVSDFRTTRLPLNYGAGYIPVLGFGTLIADAAATITARGRSKIQSFRQLPHELKRRRHRCCWLGQCSVAQLCLPRPGLRLAPRRISTSPPFRKTRLTKSIVFRSDRGLMK